MVNVTYKISSFDENLKPCSCYILGIKMTDKQLRMIDDRMWNLTKNSRANAVIN